MSALVPAKSSSTAVSVIQNQTEQFVTVSIAKQLFGLPVLDVHDILGPQKITRVPLAPAEVAGSLNLRGKIVTAINLRQTMGLPPQTDKESMHVVVHFKGNDYSLLVDRVGEVLNLNAKDQERNPPTLDPRWAEMSRGIFRLEKDLMVVLDISRVIEKSNKVSN